MPGEARRHYLRNGSTIWRGTKPLFHWKKVMDRAMNKGLKVAERVVSENGAEKLKSRIRGRDRMPGKQTMKLYLLEEAIALVRRKGTRAGTRPTKTVDSDGGRKRARHLAAGFRRSTRF